MPCVILKQITDLVRRWLNYFDLCKILTNIRDLAQYIILKNFKHPYWGSFSHHLCHFHCQFRNPVVYLISYLGKVWHQTVVCSLESGNGLFYS